jgi:hypothetical protein
MDVLFTVAQAAQVACVHPKTLYKAISAGRLKVGRVSGGRVPKGARPAHIRYGGIRISPEQLRAWLDR